MEGNRRGLPLHNQPMEIKKTDIFLLPNLITILRLVTYPYIFYFLHRGNLVLAALVMVFAGVTDILDGLLARTLNQVSDLGKILDPTVDKLGIGIFIVYATLYRGFPLWACVLVIFKDVLTLLAGLFLIRKKQIIPVSAFWGKLNSLVWGMAILSYVLNLNPIKPVFVGLGVVVVIMTALTYAMMFRRLVRG